jgi:hypothetical protein
MAFLLAAILSPIRKARQDRLVGKESSREDEDRDWEQEIGEREASLADAIRERHGIFQLVAQAVQDFHSANHFVCVGCERGKTGVSRCRFGSRRAGAKPRTSATISGQISPSPQPLLAANECSYHLCSCHHYRYRDRICCQRKPQFMPVEWRLLPLVLLSRVSDFDTQICSTRPIQSRLNLSAQY